jgi:hypothetical protein
MKHRHKLKFHANEDPHTRSRSPRYPMSKTKYNGEEGCARQVHICHLLGVLSTSSSTPPLSLSPEFRDFSRCDEITWGIYTLDSIPATHVPGRFWSTSPPAIRQARRSFDHPSTTHRLTHPTTSTSSHIQHLRHPTHSTTNVAQPQRHRKVFARVVTAPSCKSITSTRRVESIRAINTYEPSNAQQHTTNDSYPRIRQT